MSELFILSCSERDSGGGIYKFLLTANGELKRLAYFPCDKPMYGALDGQNLCVLLRAPFKKSENSGYFFIDKNLKAPSGIKSTLGKCACHLSADKDVFIANYLSGSVLKNGSRLILHTGRGVNPVRQEMPHPHFAGLSPDKKYLLCSDLGLDTIFIYDRNLSLLSAAKVPSGYGVRHLVFVDGGNVFYAINELYPSISVFNFLNGRAEYLKTVPLPVNDKNSTAAAIRLADGGKTVYASVRGENAVYALSVNGEDLRVTDKFGSNGVSPRDFDIIGNYIIVANEETGVSVIDRRNKKEVYNLPLSCPLNVIKI